MCSGDFFRHRRQRRSLTIFRRSILAHAVDRDVGAHRCQPFGECPAQPAARAGHQRDLAVEYPRAMV
jgi:hypothetical protein